MTRTEVKEALQKSKGSIQKYVIHITQEVDGYVSDASPSTLAAAIENNNTIVVDLLGIAQIDDNVIYFPADDVFTPAPVLVFNNNIYSDGMLCILFYYTPDDLTANFDLAVQQIPFAE